MDRLEDYIRNNREDLDRYSPPDNVWKAIRKSLHHKRRDVIMWFSAAAMIIVILTTAAMFYVFNRREDYTLSGKEADILLMKSNPELIESEIYYNNLIHDLYSEATPLLTGNPDVEKELLIDMAQIDSICTDIKKDLKDNVANQEVVEALINNYRIKIQILEDLLNTLKQDETGNDNKLNHAL